MTKKITGLLALPCLIYHSSVGQNDYNSKNGYIVTLSNDTIQGKLKENADLTLKINFRKLNEPNYSIFTADSLKAFSFESDGNYKSVEIDTANHKKVFLLSLVEGHLALFKMNESFVLQKKGRLTVKISVRDTLINNYLYKDKKYIGVLKFLTADQPQLSEKIDRTKFSDKDLTAVVTAYNELVTPDGSKVIVHSTGLKIEKGIIVGANLSSARTKFKAGPSNTIRKFNTKPGYMFGGWIKLYFNSKAAIRPEINIVQKKFFIHA